MNEAEKLYYRETEKSLKSGDKKIIRARIKELKNAGNASLLSLILDLFMTDPGEEIRQDILGLLANLRDQQSAAVIAACIDNNPRSLNLAELIASCWQSRLDYSAHLETFTGSFISGDYRTAIESFTVIEESLWKSSSESIDQCKILLTERVSEISEEKMPLYRERIDVLNTQRTRNSEDYPDLYTDDQE